MQGRCSKLNCEQVGIYRASVELYPAKGNYEGAPTQLFFPDLLFCEEHARALTWDALIYPDPIANVFIGLGRVVPDFSRSKVTLSLVQGSGEVA